MGEAWDRVVVAHDHHVRRRASGDCGGDLLRLDGSADPPDLDLRMGLVPGLDDLLHRLDLALTGPAVAEDEVDDRGSRCSRSGRGAGARCGTGHRAGSGRTCGHEDRHSGDRGGDPGDSHRDGSSCRARPGRTSPGVLDPKTVLSRLPPPTRCTGSSLDPGEGDSLDEFALGEEVDDHEGRGDDGRGCHRKGPVRLVRRLEGLECQ